MSKRRKAQDFIKQSHDAFLNESAQTYLTSTKISTSKFIHPANPHQKQFVKSIKNNILTIGSGEAGTGKLNPDYTEVLTPKGYVRIDSLKIGDQVISAEGTPTNVLGIYPKENLEIYEVEFSDGTFTRCCIDHLWAVRTVKETSNNTEFKVKSLRELLPNIQKRTRIKQSHYYEIPLTKPIELPEQNLPIDPYLMGCILGDGHLIKSGAFCLSVGHKDIEYFEATFKNLITRKACYNNVYHLSCNLFKEEIKELGLAGKVKHGKFIPDSYLIGSKNQRLSLLQGLLDTDGSINKFGNRITFSNNNLNLVDGVIHLVQTLGGIAAVSGRIRKEGQDRQYTVKIQLPENIQCFRLPRKNIQKRVKPIRRKIVSAKYIGQENGRCIMVEHPSHLFLLNDCIVTHNTLLALFTGVQLLNNPESPIQKIIYVRSHIKDREEASVGAIPGTLADKMRIMAYPILDNLELFMSKEAIDFTLEQEKIEVLPFMFMRGRSFQNTFVILDEAQNSSQSQLKTLLTRITETSKIVIIGDSTQCDIEPFKNGLIDLEWRFAKLNEYLIKHNRIPAIDFDIIKFNHEDILRSELTKFAIDLYNF
jgi:phosphate starvation-inducible protein PhoH